MITSELFVAVWKEDCHPHQSERTVSGAYLQNRGGFQHLSHKGGHTFQLAVTGTYSRQYAIEDRNFGFSAGNETPNLCH